MFPEEHGFDEQPEPVVGRTWTPLIVSLSHLFVLATVMVTVIAEEVSVVVPTVMLLPPVVPVPPQPVPPTFAAVTVGVTPELKLHPDGALKMSVPLVLVEKSVVRPSVMTMLPS